MEEWEEDQFAFKAELKHDLDKEIVSSPEDLLQT